MGYNDQNAASIVFDIETAPLPDAGDYLEPAEAPANYKDPAKIAAAIAEKQAEALSKCGLDVDLCRVVAIGGFVEGDKEPFVVHAEDVEHEAAMLTAFWLRYSTGRFIGFNCLSFDLPVLFRRSLYLGVDEPYIQIDKYKHPQVTDLMQVLSFNGAIKFRSLAFYCKRFGIDGGPDILKGADVAQAVAEGRWADVEAHVTADVRKTALLASKLGLFKVSA